MRVQERLAAEARHRRRPAAPGLHLPIRHIKRQLDILIDPDHLPAVEGLIEVGVNSAVPVVAVVPVVVTVLPAQDHPNPDGLVILLDDDVAVALGLDSDKGSELEPTRLALAVTHERGGSLWIANRALRCPYRAPCRMGVVVPFLDLAPVNPLGAHEPSVTVRWPIFARLHTVVTGVAVDWNTAQQGWSR